VSDDALVSAEKRDAGGKFIVPPKSPGRPKGARSKLGEEFLKAMLADFEQNGAVVISTVREEKPDQYLKVVASILPKEIEAGEETINILAELLARIDGRTRTIVPALPFTPQPQHTAH
jgi:hypothetical protein